MSLSGNRNKGEKDYSEQIYAIHLLKKYEIDALEYQEREKGSLLLANEIHGLRNVVDVLPLWLVAQTDGSPWHFWIIANIDTRNTDEAMEMYVQKNYRQILPLSYTECIDEWYEKRGKWATRI